MPRNDQTEKEMRAFAEEHLVYEIQMLFGSARELANNEHPQQLVNALLESFTIHLRALIDFLWEPPKVKRDDVLASDFFAKPGHWLQIRGELPEVLQPAKHRAGKEIAHLTYARLAVEPEAKPWPVSVMANAVGDVLSLFFENADPSLLGCTQARLNNAS